MDDSLLNSSFTSQHQFNLTNLIPETDYYLRVVALDYTQTLSDTLDSSFTTGSLVMLSLPDTAVNPGETVAVLVDGWMNSGYHRIAWEGKDINGDMVASGLYFYTLKADDFYTVKKMVMLK